MPENLAIDLPALLPKLVENKVLIVGLGREGKSNFEFLSKYFPDLEIYLTDQKDPMELGEYWQKILSQKHVLFVPADKVTNTLAKIDFCFVSPGISNQKLMSSFGINSEKIALQTNSNLFFKIIDQLPSPKPTLIGITGTKGKSTTTAAIHHVLKATGHQAALAGNIGTPLLTLLDQASDLDYVVAELSSHQLSRMHFSPNIAVVLDVTPEHLDYYPDFTAYFNAKTNICRYQTEKDLVIYNHASDTATKIARLCPGKQIGFDPTNLPISADDVTLPGSHNLLNLTPAYLIATELGIDQAKIMAALKSFAGLPHRLQLVKEENGIKFVNDSLATTPEATIAALESFDDPIVLIAGGFDRGLDYSGLANYIYQHSLQALILLPTTGQMIEKKVRDVFANHDLEPTFEIATAESMEQAVKIAKEFAHPGNVVLLSPASASFNMFKDYAERGNLFTNLVSQT